MITTIQRTAYKTSSGRCYFTALAAAKHEASDKMRIKYPSESAEYDRLGRMVDPGFSFRDNSDLLTTFNRLVRMYVYIMKSNQKVPI